MDKTPLVISFGSTLRSMAEGRIAAADLVGAIFYLGCTRQHAMSAKAALREFDNYRTDNKRLMELYQQFRAALEDAEAHGRVAWREIMEPNSWKQLNDLLESLGQPTIVPVDHDYPKRGRYCYPGVDEAVRVQELPYRVIWIR